MNATREQCIAMAKEADPHISVVACSKPVRHLFEFTEAELENLVHRAQKFERDRLRAKGGVLIWTKVPAETLYRIPETLE